MIAASTTGAEPAGAHLPELEVLLAGVFERRRFLDMIRHFIVFEEDPDTGALIKKVAGYHQFHAVNTALALQTQDTPLIRQSPDEFIEFCFTDPSGRGRHICIGPWRSNQSSSCW